MDKIFTTLGLTIVIVSVIVGYMWHDGNIFLLWQPSEFLIIGGAALGAFDLPDISGQLIKPHSFSRSLPD